MKTFLAEMQEQTEVIARCLDYYRHRKLALGGRHKSPSRIVITGMGASLYAALPSLYYLNNHGNAAQLVDTAELVHYRFPILSDCDLLVLISQSGETIEVRRLVDRLKRLRPLLVAITNNSNSTLGQKADLVLPLFAGEQHFASTKTYTSSMLVGLLLASSCSDGKADVLLDALGRSLEAYRRLLARALRQAAALAHMFNSLSDTVLLGRGPSLASALAGALLFKEVCARPAEGMTGAQFRHGPLELLRNPLGVILFAPPGPTLRMNRLLQRDLVRHRPRILWVSAAPGSAAKTRVFRLPRLANPALTPLFEILPVQALTWELARRDGRDPGCLLIAANVTLRD